MLRLRRRRPFTDPNAKPLELTITAEDGQWHTFRIGVGDGIGYAGISVAAVRGDDQHITHIQISHYTDAA